MYCEEFIGLILLKNPGCLGDLFGDYATQLYGDHHKPLQLCSLLNNQCNGKYELFFSFFGGSFGMNTLCKTKQRVYLKNGSKTMFPFFQQKACFQFVLCC